MRSWASTGKLTRNLVVVGGGAGGAIKAVTKVIDEIHTSDEERLNARNTIMKIEAELKSSFSGQSDAMLKENEIIKITL